MPEARQQDGAAWRPFYVCNTHPTAANFFNNPIVAKGLTDRRQISLQIKVACMLFGGA
jgi:hypothetical protein